ncbi:uncharacterized protein LOC114725547 isoform X2 [Neltuma alba]|uniref:uncharacterized protein LOC114725547 isoform X2 n=1 Tax=Neltuma alba TaxID=207710 RepID=UPI0010A46DF4|nr:uncharacterized protein LOC114725547 isoform X2 [Prosopis alba]
MENTSSVEFLLLQEVQFLEVKDDLLSQWEFVNVLDSEEAHEEEEEDDADGDSAPQKRTGSWVSSISWSVSPNTGPIDGIRYHLPHFVIPKLKDQPDDAEDSNGDRCFDDVENEIDGSQSGDGDADGYGGDDYEDTGDYDGYDLDDELVPWSVNTKFGRQRMRKLGKRAFSKMNNSKRSPYLYVRPGCVRGKHGLGLKHNY